MKKVTTPTDRLKLDYINSLPQPLLARFCGDKIKWPVADIDVQTGMLRIDVCGRLQIKHIGEAMEFTDDSGATHDPETFYSDYEVAPMSAEENDNQRSAS